MKAAVGAPDKKLLKEGLLARGVVLECHRGAFSTGNQVRSVVCKLRMQVFLPGEEPFEATCHHSIEEPYLPQFEQGGAAVAVRVDPADHAHIELDLATDVPPAPAAQMSPAGVMASGDAAPPLDATALPIHDESQATGGLDHVLATGQDCPCVLLAVVALPGVKTPAGLDATGLVLSVTLGGQAPYQAQVGVYVPPEAAHLLVPGTTLPGKVLPDHPNAVVIDWAAAAG